ncbi:hypothetical protein ACFZ8E_23430 [Methylobacterium sp. HMF5984]|uniref:hypothetical protein n=1 Tax=Methylobacterium sp. HMF5984 TaxID=3367370 RepID=UPI003853D597
MDAEKHPVIRALRRSDVLARRYIDYLIEHGQSYEGAPLPDGIARWPEGSCLEASEHLQNSNGLVRVQGWCLAPKSIVSSGEPFWHSFNTTDGKNAIDASLPDTTACFYFGLPGPFENPDAFDHMVLGKPAKRHNLIPPDLAVGAFSQTLKRSFRLF